MADKSILDLVEEINSVRAQLAEAKQSAADLATENKRLAPLEGELEALKTDFAELRKVSDERNLAAAEQGQRAEDAAKAQAKAEKAQAKAEKSAATTQELNDQLTAAAEAYKAQVDDLEGQVRILEEFKASAAPVVAATEALKAALAETA